MAVGHPPTGRSLSPLDQSPRGVLDNAGLVEGVRHLVAVDADLAAIVAAHGNPPLWARTPGFPTLIHIILEQQVSLASARAAFNKLAAAAEQLTPQRFLEFNDDELRRDWLQPPEGASTGGSCRGPS